MRRARFFDRLLLRAYPRQFRDEFGAELIEHLTCQRGEARYREGPLGSARYWWDAGTDTLLTSTRLRLARLRAQWSSFWGFGYDSEPRAGSVASKLEVIARDVRHALRTLLRKPAYALVFVATLGLGIGANTAMFSAVSGVLLRPLPHEDGDHLVYLRQSAQLANIPNTLFSVPEVNDYRSGTPSLKAVAEFSALTFTMLGHDMPRRVRAGIVSGNYFEVMGLSASLGRVIGAEDDAATAPGVILLSDAYWRSVFGADPRVIGKTLQVDGTSATVIGVAEPAPPYPERIDMYVNISTSSHHLDASMNHDRRHRMTEVFARLAPGATVESVRTELAGITTRLHGQYPEAYDAGSGFDVTVTPLKTQLTSRARDTFLLLLGTSFLVFIIACANLANLALTRVIRRGHELAIRVSLGASRATLRRELLIENLVLALGGTALGLLLAFVSLDLLRAYAERFTSRASEIALDPSVYGFALIAALAAAVFFTMLPTLPDSHRVSGSLRSGARTTIGAPARRAQRALVVAQVGMSFVLLIGAGLLLRTMMHLNRIDPGFDKTQILTMNIPLSGTAQHYIGDATRNRFMGILEDVRDLPGVDGAVLMSSVPLSGSPAIVVPVSVERYQAAPGAPPSRAGFNIVSPGYFSLLGIDIVRGREFVSTDTEQAQKVVVINESMAHHYFGDRDPIGHRIAWQDPLMAKYGGVSPDWRTIVGVSADIRDRGIDAEIVHTAYTPYPQLRLIGALAIRVSRDSTALMPAIRKAILAYDPNQPIENVATLEQLSSKSLATRQLNTTLLTAFAMLALIIAAVGIGGVLAFSVGSRTHEFGVRSALGAARHQIWSGVIGEGAVLAAIGVVLGSVAAAGLTRVIAGLLIGVQTLDVATFIAVGGLLGAVAIGAAWMPAWRAARVSPMEALAAE